MRGHLGARRMSAGLEELAGGLSRDTVALAGDEVKPDGHPDRCLSLSLVQ